MLVLAALAALGGLHADPGYGPPGAATHFSVSADGAFAWFPAPDGRELWHADLAAGQFLGPTPMPFPINGAAYLNDGLMACISTREAVVAFIIPPTLYYEGVLLGTSPTNRAPRLAEFDGSGASLCVLSPRSNSLEGFDSNGFQKQYETPFDSEPFGMAHPSSGPMVSLPRPGQVAKLDDATHRVVGSASVLPGVKHLGAGDDGGPLLVAASRSADAVAILDAANCQILATVTVAAPHGVQASRGPGAVAYVLSGHRRKSVVLVGADRAGLDFATVKGAVDLPEEIEAMAVAADTGKCYALAASRRTVYEIDSAGAMRAISVGP